MKHYDSTYYVKFFKVAKSTAVCDEALSNIRTVRAFAMEEKEMELYAAELEKAKIMQEKLGMGIGLYQVMQ